MDYKTGFTWAAAGAAIGTLVTLAVLRTPESPAQAPDISQMSPEERATRLFNRVMRLDQAGAADSVVFFVPMALQAYAMIPAQDADSRYHIGLIHLVGDDAAGALAQADTIHLFAPAHLFAFVLRGEVAKRAHDPAALQRAYADFRRHERDERARGRPEYQDHAAQLDAFSREANR